LARSVFVECDEQDDNDDGDKRMYEIPRHLDSDGEPDSGYGERDTIKPRDILIFSRHATLTTTHSIY